MYCHVLLSCTIEKSAGETENATGNIDVISCSLLLLLVRGCIAGDIQGVRDLVESGEIDVNEKGAQDRTALHRFVLSKFAQLWKLLVFCS